MQYPTFSLEYELLQAYSSVAGVDEVGRGCLAGPVVACMAVISNEKEYIPTLVRDSKTLSLAQREKVAIMLRKVLTDYAIGSASALEIDRLGIRKATYLAMLRAYWRLNEQPSIILMDGKSATIPLFSRTYQYNYGDLLHYAISAASILAKVSRDTYMVELEKQLPGYGFDKHKGYGTKLHYDSLSRLGVSNVHRKTFLH